MHHFQHQLVVFLEQAIIAVPIWHVENDLKRLSNWVPRLLVYFVEFRQELVQEVLDAKV